MSSLKFEFNYGSLIWMFCLKTSMNRLINITEKCLRLIMNNYDSNFKELLELSLELSIHKNCINYLMIEVYKCLHKLSPELMTSIFTFQKNSYNIPNIHLFGFERLLSLRFGEDKIALWQKLPLQ